MNNLILLDKYEKINQIYTWSYGEIFKAKNNQTGNYVAIQRIDKSKFENENKYLSIVQNMKLLKSENSVSFIEAFNTKDNFYIVMELCLINLGDYIKIRKEGLSINEIKEILIQINNILNEKIIYKNLNPSNILININKIDKILLKILDNSNNNKLTLSPEILNNEENILKNDLQSIGIIIYYLYFKEYPYKGINNEMLYKDIKSGKN